jgi:hypothetical protein
VAGFSDSNVKQPDRHTPRRRGIQYAAASRFDHQRLAFRSVTNVCGILDRPVKPGDDSICQTARRRPRVRGDPYAAADRSGRCGDSLCKLLTTVVMGPRLRGDDGRVGGFSDSNVKQPPPPSWRATGSRERAPDGRLREAHPSHHETESWIASSLSLLAMTPEMDGTCQTAGPSYPAQAGYPVRGGLSVRSRTSVEYWIARSSRAMTTGKHSFAFPRRDLPGLCG